jgi:hypothetical protein
MDTPRDAENWAQPVERLHATGTPGEPVNVEGRQLVGPLQGFGQMWQKTYRARLRGVDVTPVEVVTVWKEHYDEFWPPEQTFSAPIAGIRPGEIGLISGGTGPIKLSTGVYVIYSDDESFSFMNPAGHPFAGMITFSAHHDDDHTVAQVRLLIRANDPLMEIGFKLLGGSKQEDRMWQHTLRSLAGHFGVETEPEQEIVQVDRKRVWRNFGNIRHNAAIGTALHAVGFRRRSTRRADDTA